MGIREFSYPAWGQLSWGRLVLEPDFSRRRRFNCWRLGGLLLENWAPGTCCFFALLNPNPCNW